jgi:hypothetical protein
MRDCGELSKEWATVWVKKQEKEKVWRGMED